MPEPRGIRRLRSASIDLHERPSPDRPTYLRMKLSALPATTIYSSNFSASFASSETPSAAAIRSPCPRSGLTKGEEDPTSGSA